MPQRAHAVIELRPRPLVRALVAIALTLAAIDTALHVLNLVYGHDWVFGLAPKLDLNGERTVPAWYATIQLAFAAVLLAYIAARTSAGHDGAAREGRLRRTAPWAVLSLGFFYMSLDEMLELHTALPQIRPDIVSQWTPFLWVPTGVAIVAVVGLGFAGFLRSLPRETRNAFLLAGAVYVGGALGMEVLGGAIAIALDSTWAYVTSTTIEETMELLGVTMFISALLAYIGGGSQGRATTP